jgi:hypothetical protein
MCNDHQLLPLPEWIVRLLDTQLVRCVPALGIHEHCEHVKEPIKFPQVQL